MVRNDRNVYTNEHGFSLLEMIVTLVVFTVVLSTLFSLFLVLFTKPSPMVTDEDVNLFMFQLQLAIRSVDEYEVDRDGERLVLSVLDDGSVKTETFVLHNKRMVRQVGGLGYDIYLEGVSSVRFEQVNGGVVVQIQTVDNNSYTKRINTLIGGKKSET